MMKEEAARQEARPIDFGEWIASLEIKVEFSTPSTEEEKARVVQVSNRTNQFNFTTERLNSFPTEPVETSIVHVTDKYGDYGIAGVMLFSIEGTRLTLINFMMSCRVLGRGVEQRMMAWLGETAVKRGCDKVKINFTPTVRNVPAKKFLNEYSLMPDGGASLAAADFSAETVRDIGARCRAYVSYVVY